MFIIILPNHNIPQYPLISQMRTSDDSQTFIATAEVRVMDVFNNIV